MKAERYPRDYIERPPRELISIQRNLIHFAAGAFLSPVYFLAAYRFPTRGLSYHRYCSTVAFRLLLSCNTGLSLFQRYYMFFSPMDSVRYFEFDFAWNRIKRLKNLNRYLDISSPRMMPVRVIDTFPDLNADVLNPDLMDLNTTKSILRSLRHQSRCKYWSEPIEDANFDEGTFDLITCISVLEHIPDFMPSLGAIWRFLRKGGSLILTFPCAATAVDQFRNFNEYNLVERNEAGRFFFQHFIDQKMIDEQIFPITGQPNSCKIYGEETPGFFSSIVNVKMKTTLYPFWKEPYIMGRNYVSFSSISQLPGEGILCMEFVK